MQVSLQIYGLGLISLALLAFLRLYRYSKLSIRPPRYPPGPKTMPFLGNLHQIPISRPELKFNAYARDFGPLTGLKLGIQNMVILNTWQAVRDLVEQKGTIYSSRPTLPVFDIVIPGGLNPALNVYGDIWRKQRRLLVEFLGGERTDRMKPVQDAESTQMIYDILRQPAKFQDHIDRSFGAIILATVFGQRGKTLEPDGKVPTFFRIEEEWAAAVGPTASPPINSFPFLSSVPDWLTPWKGWKKRALVIKKEQSQLYLGLLEETKQRLAQGKGTDCFLSQCLKKQDKEWSDDVYLGYVGGVLLEGGAETSASTTMVFILAMAAYPDVLERAQEEVDRICGVSNMPGTNDINRLPYIRACMMEILRWRPILPNGLPHHTTGKDTYQNYDIPTDTNIIINTWTINHDETFYDNPAAFNPSRYLQNEYGSAAYSANLDAYKGRRVNYTFGAGRRVCPGQRFAENSLMLHFAKLVWAFDMEPIGKLPVDSWDGWTDGIVTRPKDLNVQFKLRDERRNKVIEKAWLEADAFLRQYES